MYKLYFFGYCQFKFTKTEHSTAHQESHICLELDTLGIVTSQLVTVYKIYH